MSIRAVACAVRKTEAPQGWIIAAAGLAQHLLPCHAWLFSCVAVGISGDVHACGRHECDSARKKRSSRAPCAFALCCDTNLAGRSQHQPQVEVILLVEQGWGCRVCTDQSEGWELRCCLARGLTGAGCSWTQVWMAGRSSRVAHHPVFTCSRPNQCGVPGFPHCLSLQFSVATPCLFGPAVGGREVPGPY